MYEYVVHCNTPTLTKLKYTERNQFTQRILRWPLPLRQVLITHIWSGFCEDEITPWDLSSIYVHSTAESLLTKKIEWYPPPRASTFGSPQENFVTIRTFDEIFREILFGQRPASFRRNFVKKFGEAKRNGILQHISICIVYICLCTCVRKRVHVCTCTCTCMYLSKLHVPIKCLCCMSLLQVMYCTVHAHAACPCHMSMSHVCMLHVHAARPCRGFRWDTHVSHFICQGFRSST